MGEEDIRRQALKSFGCDCSAPSATCRLGHKTLKDAISEAFRDWISTVESSHYYLGSVAGPHPFPNIVRDFQAVIGLETRGQFLDRGMTTRKAVACVGGGSNATGTFEPSVEDAHVELIGIEAGGRGPGLGQNAATLNPATRNSPRRASYVLQDPDGQIARTHGVSTGLDYPGVGPEHAYLKDAGRVRYVRPRRPGSRSVPAARPRRRHHARPRIRPRRRPRPATRQKP